MKICIPTENKEGLSDIVYGHFGSAPYFTIYDTEKASCEVLDNTNSHHSHGTCQPLGALGASAIDVVICLGMGARAVEKLNEAHVKAYKIAGTTVAEIITKFKSGEFEEITVQNACAQHGCH
ncbi:MAG: NifB/NifX family molybdenum-iron cluster-binding protein [Candidatus Omnitrophota bacterium]|nr:NifB/NifX family molybdenum-iron cluster-binding protein [Candidatus Omnitrophota bacterium]